MNVLTRGTLCLAVALCCLIAGKQASAGDALNGLTPIAPSTLNMVRTDISNRASIANTTINASGGGQVVNGAIQNNSVSNTRGVTSVMQNTGNNVNFNSALVINVIQR